MFGIGPIDIQSDAPQASGGNAVRELRPGATGITGFVNSATGSATVEAPRRAPPLIRGCVENFVVGWILDELGGACVLVDEQDVVPRQSAIGGLEDTPFLAGTPKATQRGDVDDVVVHGIHDDAGDVLRVAKPHVLPRLSPVGRLVDAVAPRAALPVVVLPCADPYQIGVVLRDRDVTDRDGVVEVVEEHLPRRAHVGGFPETTRGGADVEDGWIRFQHRQIVDAATHGGRADVAEGQPREGVSGGSSWGCRASRLTIDTFRDADREGHEQGGKPNGSRTA